MIPESHFLVMLREYDRVKASERRVSEAAMSASERLAALDAVAANGPFIMDDLAEHGLAMLRNALPEIVAVVRAAEQRFDGTSYETATPTALGKSDLYDALCALNRVLREDKP